MFDGHIVYKIGEEWVFDLTEFIGYRVITQGNKVISYDKAFTVKRSKGKRVVSNDKSFIVGGSRGNTYYKFNEIQPIPLGVMQKSKEVIEYYLREALIHE